MKIRNMIYCLLVSFIAGTVFIRCGDDNFGGETPIAISKLTLDSNFTSSGAGTCVEIKLRTRAADDSERNVSEETPITISATDGKIYSDSECATEVTSVTIEKDAYEKVFYFKHLIPGDYTVTATAGSEKGWTDATLNLAMQVTADRLSFNTSADSTTTFDCVELEIELRDGTNTEAFLASDLALTPTVPNDGTTPYGSFYSDSSCTSAITSTTISVKTSSVKVYFKPVLPGSSVSLKASALDNSGLSEGTDTFSFISSILTGTWVSDCEVSGSLYEKRILSFPETLTEITYRVVKYSNSTCDEAQLYSEQEFRGEYEFGTLNSADGTRNINFIYDYSQLDACSSQANTDFNNSNKCAKTNWSGSCEDYTWTETTGTTSCGQYQYVTNGDTVYELFKIDTNGKLKFGNKTLYESGSAINDESQRPISLHSSNGYTKQ